MEEKTREVELHLSDFWNTFKRCWLILLITVVVVFVGLYIILSATHVDEYEAEVTIYILRNSNENTDNNTNTNLVQDISIANALIDDCKRLILSRDHVLQPVLDATPALTDTTWRDLERMISIENSGEDRILTLSVTSSDPQMSAHLANGVAERAGVYFNKEYDQNIFRIVDKAEVPREICNPVSKLLVLLIALLVALVIYIINFIRFLMDDKINSAEDVEKYLGLSMLGMIPNRQDSVRRKSRYGYYYSSSQNGTSDKQ